MKPHFINKWIKIEFDQLLEQFIVLIYQPTTKQHGWRWVWENSFETFSEARQWAHEQRLF